MLTPGRHYIGTKVRIAVNFQDDDGTDVDPSTVTFKAKSPVGDITTYVYATDAQLIRTDTGDFFVDFEPNEPGRWHYRWLSTGTGTATALEGTFVVQDSEFETANSDAY